MMTSNELGAIITRNLRDGEIPANPVAIVGFEPRVPNNATTEDEAIATANARYMRTEVYSKEALDKQFSENNFTVPGTNLDLSETERSANSIVDFNREILVQLIALRQAIEDAEDRNDPLLKPFVHEINNENITADHLNAWRTEILRYLNSRSQDQLDEARAYVNHIRTLGNANVLNPIQITVDGRTLHVDGRIFIGERMHTVSEVGHLEAGNIRMAGVAMSADDYNNIQSQIEALAAQAKTTADQSEALVNHETINDMLQEAAVLVRILPNAKTDADLVEQRVQEARRLAAGADENNSPVSVRGNANQLQAIATRARTIRHNARNSGTLRNALQSAQAAGQLVRDRNTESRNALAAATEALERARGLVRDHVAGSVVDSARASGGVSGGVILAAAQANGLRDEAQRIQTAHPIAAPLTNVVRDQVALAHRNADDQSNANSAISQAALALRLANEARGVPLDSKANAERVETLVNNVQRANGGVTQARTATETAITNATRALDRARRLADLDPVLQSARDADTRARQADQAAIQADAMRNEAAQLSRIANNVANDVTAVNQQLDAAHRHANGTNNNDSARSQANRSMDEARNAERILADVNGNGNIDAQLQNVTAANQGVAQADTSTRGAIRNAEEALERIRDAVRQQIDADRQLAQQSANANTNAQSAINGADAMIREARDLGRNNPAMANDVRAVEDGMAMAIRAAQGAAQHAGRVQENSQALDQIQLNSAQNAANALQRHNAIGTEHQATLVSSAQATTARGNANQALERCREARRQALRDQIQAVDTNALLADAQRLVTDANNAVGEIQQLVNEAQPLTNVPVFQAYRNQLNGHLNNAQGHANHAGTGRGNVADLIQEFNATPVDQLEQRLQRLRNAQQALQGVQNDRNAAVAERDAARNARNHINGLHNINDWTDLNRLAALADQAALAAETARNNALALHTELGTLGPSQAIITAAAAVKQRAEQQAIVARQQATLAAQARDANNRDNAQTARINAEAARDATLAALAEMTSLRNSAIRDRDARNAAAAAAAAAKIAAENAARSGMDRIIYARINRGATQPKS